MLLFLLIPCSNVFADPGLTEEGIIIRIADGDTLTVINKDNIKIKIRVWGIDCPEINQEYGNKSKELVQSVLSLNSTLRYEPIEIDKYGRTVAIVYLQDGTTLQEFLIYNGAAWVFERYCNMSICDNWRELQSYNQSKGIGLFSSINAVPPWEWRRQSHKK